MTPFSFTARFVSKSPHSIAPEFQFSSNHKKFPNYIIISFIPLPLPTSVYVRTFSLMNQLSISNQIDNICRHKLTTAGTFYLPRGKVWPGGRECGLNLMLQGYRTLTVRPRRRPIPSFECASAIGRQLTKSAGQMQ